jgi:hypothetical protein
MTTTLRSVRPLGSISAENDSKFALHFVDTPAFASLLDDDCMIITGAKGSGKTAIMRALSDLEAYRHRYCHVQSIKLDGLRFGPLFEAMKKLNNTSNQGLVAIARSAWQNVVAIYILEGLLDTPMLPSSVKVDVRKYLHSTGHLGTPAADKFTSHLERVWQLIVKWSRDNEKSAVVPMMGLTTRQQSVIAAFPGDDKLDRLLASAMRCVQESKRRFLLCFDGLDSVIEHSIESRDYIFAGLIDAVFKCKSHPLLADTLTLKVLLPKELAHGAKRLLRDLDKIEQFSANIHWTSDALADFLKRRLEDHLKNKNRSFDEVWREFFPDKIRNDVHGVEEETWSYFLRHSLYRPRQVLLHVQAVLDAWDNRSPNQPFRVDPTFIPNIVADTNVRLSQHVVNELQLDFPHLELLLRSFRGLPSVMPASEITSRFERYLGISPERIDETLIDLYNYGLFGVSVAAQSQEARRPSMSFIFGFMSREIDRHVLGFVADRSLIALAPMFTEYCGCRSSTVGVVSPSAQRW